MASQEVLQAFESMVCERDRQEFALGDTLDIKTGLILAALTFLAIQSSDLIHNGLSSYCKVAQGVSVVALIIGGIFVTLELWPSDYAREANPAKYQEWLAEMEKFQQQNPDEPMTPEKLRAARVDSALKSVATNSAINKKKSNLMLYAFTCTMVAFAVNVITLAIRLF